ncbi:Pentatricopeptide repeat-containing protein mitochondrial [Spatholobus suberectus]|nr:Pentatricopeptide repeat-containing protein mitochondrial [Spatholobus suberectus]
MMGMLLGRKKLGIAGLFKKNLWEMTDKQRSANFITYRTVLDEICRRGTIQEGMRFLQELQEKDLVDGHAYRKLLYVLEDDCFDGEFGIKYMDRKLTLHELLMEAVLLKNTDFVGWDCRRNSSSGDYRRNSSSNMVRVYLAMVSGEALSLCSAPRVTMLGDGSIKREGSFPAGKDGTLSPNSTKTRYATSCSPWTDAVIYGSIKLAPTRNLRQCRHHSNFSHSNMECRIPCSADGRSCTSVTYYVQKSETFGNAKRRLGTKKLKSQNKKLKWVWFRVQQERTMGTDGDRKEGTEIVREKNRDLISNAPAVDLGRESSPILKKPDTISAFI